MMKLFTTTALLAALAMPALAVQPAEGEKLAQNQTYTYWLLDAIKSLDPAKNTDVEGSDVLRSLFEGLMNEDAKGAMIPGVAESFEESDDKLTYTFRLRDAKWAGRRLCWPLHRAFAFACCFAYGPRDFPSRLVVNDVRTATPYSPAWHSRYCALFARQVGRTWQPDHQAFGQ